MAITKKRQQLRKPQPRAFSFKPHHIERAAEGSEPWRSALVPWPSWAKKQIQDELKGSDIPTMRLPLHIQWKFPLRSPTSSSGKCPPGPSSLRLPSNRRPPPLPPFANKPKQLCKLPVASPPKFVDDFFSKSSPLTTHSIDLDPFSSLSDEFLLMDGDSPVNFHLPPDSPDKRARVPLAHSPVKRQKQKPKGRPPSPHPMAIRRPHQSSNQPNQSNQSDQPNQPNHPHGKPVPRRGGISPTGAADILQSLQSPRTAILQSQSLRKKLKATPTEAPAPVRAIADKATPPPAPPLPKTAYRPLLRDKNVPPPRAPPLPKTRPKGSHRGAEAIATASISAQYAQNAAKAAPHHRHHRQDHVAAQRNNENAQPNTGVLQDAEKKKPKAVAQSRVSPELRRKPRSQSTPELPKRPTPLKALKSLLGSKLGRGAKSKAKMMR